MNLGLDDLEKKLDDYGEKISKERETQEENLKITMNEALKQEEERIKNNKSDVKNNYKETKKNMLPSLIKEIKEKVEEIKNIIATIDH